MVKAQDFTYVFDLIFAKPFYDSSDVKVKQDSSPNFASTDPVQVNSAVEPAFSCSSVYMNNFSWRWIIAGTPCGTNTQAVGIWVNFQSTLSSEVMKFGNSAFNKNSYVAKSTIEGFINIIYIDETGSNGSNWINFLVPIKSWNFMVIKWDNLKTYVFRVRA